jgi:hypothetical protein
MMLQYSTNRVGAFGRRNWLAVEVSLGALAGQHGLIDKVQ